MTNRQCCCRSIWMIWFPVCFSLSQQQRRQNNELAGWRRWPWRHRKWVSSRTTLLHRSSRQRQRQQQRQRQRQRRRCGRAFAVLELGRGRQTLSDLCYLSNENHKQSYAVTIRGAVGEDKPGSAAIIVPPFLILHRFRIVYFHTRAYAWKPVDWSS